MSKMSSEVEKLKTSEFLRRRKLRILQVREQSKDIAQKIRQRTKLEQHRHILDLDAKKEKEYLEKQEKIVEDLERQYANGLKNIGASHKNAAHIQQVTITPQQNLNLSKIRGRAAAAHMRQNKQKVLDEKKKSLDRKLQAREVANILSRDKSVTVANLLKSSCKVVDENKVPIGDKELHFISNADNELVQKANLNDNPEQNIAHTDMATQWESNILSNECQPVVPDLQLQTSEVANIYSDTWQNKSDKRLNLFAVSDEMPLSKHGINRPPDTSLFKPSNVITDYLHNRGMRLRESEPISSKPSANDLQKIKQTIVKSRAAKSEGIYANNICKVLDNEVVPVPSWHAESDCHFCLNSMSHNKAALKMDGFKYCSVGSVTARSNMKDRNISPKPVLRGCSPFHRNRICTSLKCSENSTDVETGSKTTSSNLNKKSSLTMYNHATKDIKNVVSSNEKLVVRDLQEAENAYSQAIKVTSNMTTDHSQKKLQDMRHKVAVTKKKVDKDYEDTMAFLKSLPKTSNDKPIRKAYMSEFRQQQNKEIQEHKMQHEFRNIEKSLRKNLSMNESGKVYTHRKQSKSVDATCFDDTIVEAAPGNVSIVSDNQYSWIPIPEAEGSLAIHKVQNSKGNKTQHSVKFDDTNSYHEYRSRHKHTPPTKDKPNVENDQHFEIEQSSREEDTIENSSTSLSSSSSNIINEPNNGTPNISETGCAISNNDRIIIYRILNSEKSATKEPKLTEIKLSKKVITSLTSIDKKICRSFENKKVDEESVKMKCNGNSRNSDSVQHSFEQLDEGIYKSVKDNRDNINSCYYANKDEVNGEQSNHQCECGSSNVTKLPIKHADKVNTQVPSDYETFSRVHNKCNNCGAAALEPTGKIVQSHKQGVTESTLSFQTATMENHDINMKSMKDMINVRNGNSKTAGNFYIGASGVLNDDDYEVIIQLKKKDLSNKNIIQKVINNDQPKSNTNVLDHVTSASQPIPTETASKDNEMYISESSLKNESIKSHPKDHTNENLLHGQNIEDKLLKSIIKTNSAFTQTTLPLHSSPTHQPFQYHLSSSTSTTYLSPPEKILPKSLIRNQDILVHPFYSTKDITNGNSISESYSPLTTDSFVREEEVLRNRTQTNRRNKNGKHHKCKKGKKKQKIHDNETTVHKSNTKSQDKNAEIKNSTKCNLNPIIKTYVNRVLKLNKDDLKALHLSEQYCSSVSTPGSSVVNISSNLKRHEIRRDITNIAAKVKETVFKDKSSRCGQNLKKHKAKELFNNYKKNKINKVKIFQHKKYHKVKTLNISKNLTNKQYKNTLQLPSSVSSPIRPSTTSSSNLDLNEKKSTRKNDKITTKSKSAPMIHNDRQTSSIKTSSDMHKMDKIIRRDSINIKDFNIKFHKPKIVKKYIYSLLKDYEKSIKNKNPTDIETQTSQVIGNETTKYLQLEVNKIQNMEKIADLTEKCTKRLSDLAKFLEEVRRNKSTTNNQHSSNEASLDINQDTDTRGASGDNKSNLEQVLPKKIIQTSIQSIITSKPEQNNIACHNLNITKSNPPVQDLKILEPVEVKPKNCDVEFVPLLKDIPTQFDKHKVISQLESGIDTLIPIKGRSKPPPALSRIILKCGEDNAEPHELSTVPEVESPTSFLSNNINSLHDSNNGKVSYKEINEKESCKKTNQAVNPDLLQTNLPLSQSQLPHTNIAGNAKMQMMDLTEFNKIMLTPFFSFDEYVKQCNIEVVEEGSNLEEVAKGEVFNDEMSSLHSDCSIPDVIAELMKRDIISEPFKYDSISNSNSNTVSSDSSRSKLILSKRKNDFNQSSISKYKESASDSLSISSNPDLENALKKLGLGWASSTLKKTKERLALSSSTSTSTSSKSQKNYFKKYERSIQNVPVLISDAMSKELNDLKISYNNKATKQNKNQQSLHKPITVKDFLQNELAGKITFCNKTISEDTEQYFTSLYSTKLPTESINLSEDLDENKSLRDVSQPGSRQRTSTPVQLFKSSNYNTNSSSNNNSNGLFSNVDDLSSVQVTSSSLKNNNSNTDKDELSIPSYSLKKKDKP